MNIKTFSLLAVLFIPLIALSAQDSLIEKRSTEQLKHYQQQELALDSLIGRLSKEGETIKAIMSWMADYNTDLLCVYYGKPRAAVIGRGHGAFGEWNTLVFYRKDSTGYKEIYRERADFLLGMFPDRDAAGNLITIWESASAYTFTVYAYRNNRVEAVLGDGSKGLPEFMYDTAKTVKGWSKYDIIVSDIELHWNKKTESHYWAADSARVYISDGDQYRKITVPWKDRFKASQRKSVEGRSN